MKTQHTPNEPGFFLLFWSRLGLDPISLDSRHPESAEEKSMISELKALAEQMSKEPLERWPEIGMICFS